jgi:predicted Zn-dependent peptidase
MTLPPLHETRLGNGLRVLSANTGGGMFALRLVFEGPAVYPAERPAVVRLMVRVLFAGTPTHDGHALRRVFEKRFAQWGTDTDPDAVSIDLKMPADDVKPCIDVLADVVQHPVFDPLEINFNLLQLTEQGQTARESPATVSMTVFGRAIFGDGNVYARPSNVLGGSPTVDKVEMQRVYDTIVDPSSATLLLAGAVDHALLEHIEHAFGAWRSHAHSTASPVAPVTWKVAPRVVVVDRPGSVQSQITFGGLAPPRSSPDWYAMTMIHQILGAHRSSRLTRALVERDASSFTGATHLEPYRAEGAFYWDSSVPISRTASVLREIDKQLHDLTQTAPPQDELDEKKALYLRQFPLWFETAYETVLTMAAIPAFKLGNDALDQLASGIRAVTPEAVRKLAADRLATDHTRVVVVGDWSKLKTELKALAWGPIEIRDASGKLLRTEK